MRFLPRLVLAAFGYLALSHSAAGSTSEDNRDAVRQLERTRMDLTRWTLRHESSQTSLAEGAALALDRSRALKQCVTANAEAVLEHALSLEEYAALPADVAALVEKPISGVGDLEVFCATPPPGSDRAPELQRVVVLNGTRYPATVYGRRAFQTSKIGIPISGVLVDGTFLVAENALQEIAPAAIGRATVLDPGSVKGGGVIGRVGGKLYRFSSREALQHAEQNIRASEQSPGPHPARSFEELITQPAAAALLNGSFNEWANGPKKTLTIRIDFSDLEGEAFTKEHCQTMMDNEVAPFYASASYGKTSLINTVTEKVYRMPKKAVDYATVGAGDSHGIAKDAMALAKADYPETYDRYLFVFRNTLSIPGNKINWLGFGEVGASRAFFNGAFDFYVVKHELAHNCGVFHANLWKVNGDNPVDPAGTHIEYGDPFDPQGRGDAMPTDFNPSFKRVFDWLEPGHVREITSSGTYRIRGFDHNAPGPDSVVALTCKKDDRRTYYISYRSAWKSPAATQEGAYIVWTQYDIGVATELLDMAPRTETALDGILPVGATFVDPEKALSIRVVGATGAGKDRTLEVEVAFYSPGRLPEMEVGKATVGSATTIAVKTGEAPRRTELYIDGVLWQESIAANPTFTWIPSAGGTHAVTIKTCYADRNDATFSKRVQVSAPHTWTWVTPTPHGDQVNGLAYAFNQWWATSEAGVLIGSSDGRSWVEKSFAAKTAIGSIATDGTHLIASTESTDGTPSLWRTTDGIAWSEISSKTLAENVQRVAYLNRTWIAIVDACKAMTSPDGITWTAPRTFTTSEHELRYVAYGAGNWVFPAADGDIFTSPDLENWDRPGQLRISAGRQLGVVYNNHRWLVAYRGEYEGKTGSHCFLSSDLRTFEPVVFDAPVIHVAVIDDRFVVCTPDALYTSSDGSAWTAIPLRNSGIGALGKANGAYIAGGSSGRMYAGASLDTLSLADSDPRITLTGVATLPDGTPLLTTTGFTSTDQKPYPGAVTLQERSIRTTDFSNRASGIAHWNGNYVIVGDGIYTSADGRNWTACLLPVSATLTAVAATSNGFVATGTNGVILGSPDGISWTVRSSTTTRSLSSVAVDNTGRTLVAVGEAGTILASQDEGQSWTPSAAECSTDLRRIVWQDGIGFCTVDSSDLLISKDGITWTRNLTETAWSGLCASPHGLLLSGNGRLGISADGRNVTTGWMPASGPQLFYAGDTLYASADGILMLSLKRPTPSAPAITIQPVTTAGVENGSTTLTVEASGSGPFVYQWYKDGNRIAGASSTVLTFDSVQSADAGTYTVSIGNPGGTATSAPAVLTVQQNAITIVSRPSSGIATLGANLTLSVSATIASGGTLSYQWYRNGTPVSGATNASLILSSIGLENYGEYRVTITTGAHTASSVCTVAPPADLQASSDSLTLPAGSTYAFTIRDPISGVRYQWTRNGALIAEVEGPTLIGRTAASGPETIRATASVNGVTSVSPAVSITTANPPDAGRLTNVSVLTRSGTGDEALTVGFVSSGRKQVLIRGIGPTLAVFQVPDLLLDPELTLFRNQAPAGSNNDWGGEDTLRTAFSQVGAFALDASSKDAAITSEINGVYTARVTGVNSTAGSALLEVYDLTTGLFADDTPRLVNVSCRAFVGPGDRSVTLGFVIIGDTAKTVLIRAIGPTLKLLGVGAPLSDPQLTLFASQQRLGGNDDWRGVVPSAVFDAVGAFGLPSTASKDAAMVITLPPGLYTVRITPADSSSGIALGEVYEVR